MSQYQYLPFRSVRNWWLYFLLKAGVLRQGVLEIMTRPDRVKISFTAGSFRLGYIDLKGLLKAVVRGGVEYHCSSDEMVVINEAGTIRQRHRFDFHAFEPVRFCLENGLDIVEQKDPAYFIVAVNGMRFWVRKQSINDMNVLKLVCQQDEYSFLYPFLPGSVVLDIGANIGDTAVIFTRKGARRVEAYEPHALMAELAVRNVRLNACEDKVRIYNAAVASRDGQLSIVENAAAGSVGGPGLVTRVEGSQVMVQAVSITGIMDRMKDVDVLKIDCEGAEFDIIPALSVDQLRRFKAIGMEYHREPSALVSRLKAAGFNVTIVEHSPEALIGVLLAQRV